MWDGAPKDSSHAAIFDAFRNTISRLSASGKNIVIFIDWPELGFDPRSCLPRPVRLFSQVRSLCGVPRGKGGRAQSCLPGIHFRNERRVSRPESY